VAWKPEERAWKSHGDTHTLGERLVPFDITNVLFLATLFP
jgi:hypothetical protein